MDELKDLISKANVYINSQKTASPAVLQKIAKYVTKILHTFGVIEGNTEIGFSSAAASSEVDVRYFYFCSWSFSINSWQIPPIFA